jgi:(p)ppGpp synthase/HD superfamily hydrolase
MTQLVDQARAFAIEAHGDQRYGDRPYADHLGDVARIVAEFGGSDEQIAAAWLHDTLEDCPTVRYPDLLKQFGRDVSDMVWACTGKGATRDERNAKIYEKIAKWPAAAIVKVADRIANVEASEPGSKHAERYLDEREEFFHGVAVRVLTMEMVLRLSAAYGHAAP